MNKIFLTGSSGILGLGLLKNLNDEFIFLNLIHKKKINIKYNQIKFPKVNKNNIKKLILGFKPNIILHAAAITDIEYCQKNKKKCYETNFYFTKYLVDIAKQLEIKLVFISTDQMYDKKYPQKETETPKIYNYYAKTKIQSEKYIERHLKNYLILRTNFFGNSQSDKLSFSDFIINNLKKKKNIYLFEDVFFNPIAVENFCEILKKLILQNIYGKFNIGTNNGISKYNFGIKVAKILNLNSDYIFRDKFLERTTLSARSLDMRMNISKIKKIIKNDKLFNLNYNLSLLKK